MTAPVLLPQRYEADLDAIAAAARAGRPVWAAPEVMRAGLPTRRNGRCFQGANVLVLWHALHGTELLSQVHVWTPTNEPQDGDAVVLAYAEAPRRYKHHHRVVPSPRWVRTGRMPWPAALAGFVSLPDQAPLASATLGHALLRRANSELIVTPSPREAEARARLGAALGRTAADELVATLAVAFLAARFQQAVELPARPIPMLEGFHLRVAAQLGWRVADTLWAQARAWRPVRETGPAEPVGDDGETTARAWAEAHVARWRAEGSPALLEALGLSAQLAARADRWVRQRPRQAAAWAEPILVRTGDRWRRAGAWAEVIAELCREAIGPKGGRGRREAGDLERFTPSWASELGRAHAATVREGAVPRGDPGPASEDPEAFTRWEAWGRRHLRSTWAANLPVAPVGLLQEALPMHGWLDPTLATSLGEVARRLLSRQLSPVDESAFFQQIHPARPPEPRPPRWRNRALRAELRAASSVGEAPAQLPLFPDRTPPWGPLLDDPTIDWSYRTHRIPRRAGGTRTLHVPSAALAQAQRRIGQVLATYFGGTASMAAFLPFRSPSWHARAHAGATQALSIDIQDFFGQVRPHHVRACLSEIPFTLAERAVPVHPFRGWSPEGIEALLRLIFHPGVGGGEPFLAQGAPSSPVVANLAAAALDRQIGRMLQSVLGPAPIAYSRYADDLLISTSAPIPDFHEQAARLVIGALREQGWAPNRAKTRFWSAGRGPLVVCGAVVPAEADGRIGLPRESARRARVAAHRARQAWEAGASPDPRDAGLLSHVYALTGEPRWLAHASPRLERLAERAVGPVLTADYLAGWGEP